MRCPRCKSLNTIRYIASRNECIAPGCGAVEFSPITYANETNNYEGEHAHESRAAASINEYMRTGGIVLEFEGKNSVEINRILSENSEKHDKDYMEVSSKINHLITRLKAVDAIKSGALIQYTLLIRKAPAVREHLSIDALAAFCVYWAYFIDGLFKMEDRVRKKAHIEKHHWIRIKKKIQAYTTGTEILFPKLKLEQQAEEAGDRFGLTPEQREVYVYIIKSIKNYKLCKGETLNTQLAAGLWLLVRSHEELNRTRSLAQIAEQEQITEETIKKFIKSNILPYSASLDLFPADYRDRRAAFRLQDLVTRDDDSLV